MKFNSYRKVRPKDKKNANKSYYHYRAKTLVEGDDYTDVENEDRESSGEYNQ